MECPVFCPTLAEVQGLTWEQYIENIEDCIAGPGICKIVMPEGWTPRQADYHADTLDFRIDRPIRQHATGSKGLYRALYIEQKPMSLKHDFRPQALHRDNVPNTSDPAALERKYWKNVALQPPLYGADVLGSLFDHDCKGWSLRQLDTLLDRVLRAAGHSLPGVSEPYLYFGMWRSTFAWHTEDLDLYSVNYLHYGAPKQWYVIPPAARQRFEGLVKGMIPDLFRACPEFFRHKELIVSPTLLDKWGVPYVKVVQHPREFIVVYPGAYHAGFNHGYNCAESVNFGTRRWVPLGAAAGVCRCNPDSVTIDMRLFRDLVPSCLLPPELFEDTASEDDQEEGAAGYMDGVGAWGSSGDGGSCSEGGIGFLGCGMARAPAWLGTGGGHGQGWGGGCAGLQQRGAVAGGAGRGRGTGRPRGRPRKVGGVVGCREGLLQHQQHAGGGHWHGSGCGGGVYGGWTGAEYGCCGGMAAVIIAAAAKIAGAVTAAAAAAAAGHVSTRSERYEPGGAYWEEVREAKRRRLEEPAVEQPPYVGDQPGEGRNGVVRLTGVAEAAAGAGGGEQVAAGAGVAVGGQPPVKRGPGRPRKHPLPGAPAAAADAVADADECVGGAGGAGLGGGTGTGRVDGGGADGEVGAVGLGAHGQQPAKRPRGRPRKHPLPVLEGNHHHQQQQQQQQQQGSGAASGGCCVGEVPQGTADHNGASPHTAPSWQHGRPAAEHPLPLQPAAVPDSHIGGDSSEAVGVVQQQERQPAKRPRGRPRKNPLPASSPQPTQPAPPSVPAWEPREEQQGPEGQGGADARGGACAAASSVCHVAAGTHVPNGNVRAARVVMSHAAAQAVAAAVVEARRSAAAAAAAMAGAETGVAVGGGSSGGGDPGDAVGRAPGECHLPHAKSPAAAGQGASLEVG